MRHATNGSPAPCGSGALERSRYFNRQLITKDELTQDQDYFRQRMRLHNRLLWGWGTVCGALVCRLPAADGGGEADPWKVVVKPGYLLGPHGDDIVIGGEVPVDLRSGGVAGTAGEEPEMSAGDPWCSRVCLPREPGPLYVAVRYRECMTRPVRVQPAGCGCEGEQCEYTRLRDGYEIGILDRCPGSHEGEAPAFDPGSGPIPPCPPCPDDPWVVLARVEIGETGIEGEPDNCACRRMVVSLAPFWWRCEEEPAGGGGRPTVSEVSWARPDGSAVSRPEFTRGEVVVVGIAGTGFPADARIALGAGFEARDLAVSPEKLATTIAVLATAPLGPQRLRIVGADNRVLVQRARFFRVIERPVVNPPLPPPGGGTPQPPAPHRAPRAPRRRSGGAGPEEAGGGGEG